MRSAHDLQLTWKRLRDKIAHTARSLLCALALATAGLCAGAQTFAIPDPGPGVVPITGLWQFHTGDDLRWADPAFDDRSWQAVRGDKPWGAQGHFDYRGYAWYRRRVEIGKGDAPLGLLIPLSDGAYEVYWNGAKIGQSGQLPPHARWYTFGQNAVFPLGGSKGEAVAGLLAVRFWAAPAGVEATRGLGGFRGFARVGRLALLQQQVQLATFRREHQELLDNLVASQIGALGLLSLVLFVLQRRQWLYLWLSLLLLGSGTTFVLTFFYRDWTFIPVQIAGQIAIVSVYVGLWLVLLWLFDLRHDRRWRAITIGVSVVEVTAMLLDCVCLLQWRHAGPGLLRLDRVLNHFLTWPSFYVLILVAVGLAHRRSWSLVPLGLFGAAYGIWGPLLNGLLLLTRPALAYRVQSWSLPVGDIQVNAYTVLSWLLMLVLALTVALRQMREGRRRRLLEQEIRSAQEVQHVLVPQQIPPIAGLDVSSVYKPAAEVGGDFFQVIPPGLEEGQAGTLIVIGDVSGKGLKAAMTVSLIVGTLRTLAEGTHSPGAILAGLNRRLLGRTQGGFATCTVLRVDGDGAVVLANAGHLPPFRDGHEWETPASLPLGLAAEAEFDEVRLHLREDETLTLITDGVLEARNSKGDLYGFERVAALMHRRPSPEQVAEAACGFGQEDDITVVCVKRTGSQAMVPAMEMMPMPAVG